MRVDPMFDILIKNGRVVDGTGNPWFKADVGLENGKIAQVSKAPLKGGERVIDARGLVVTPGFIDMHSHSDTSVLVHPRCESFIRQGITTAVTGSCGISVAPISKSFVGRVRHAIRSRAPDPDKVVVDWLTLEEYRQRVEGQGIAMNIAQKCGYETIKNSVMGTEKLGEATGMNEGKYLVMPTDDELKEMKKMAASAMEDGAFAISNSLNKNILYPEELVELAKVVSSYGGYYDTHNRGNNGDAVIEGLKEAIMVGREADIPVHLAHFYALMPWNWGKSVECMRLVDEARASGVDVSFDIYPWQYCMMSNPIALFVPGGTMNERTHNKIPVGMTMDDILSDMRDPEKWMVMKEELAEAYEDEYARTAEKQKELLRHGIRMQQIVNPQYAMVIVSSKTHPELVGKYLNEVGEAMGMDWMDAVRKVILDDEGLTHASQGGMREDDTIAVLTHPAGTVSTDGSAMDQPPPATKPPHPRNYGSFPRVLARYVRELGSMSLETAINKFSGLPVRILDIRDRGLLKEGMWADVVVFSPETVKPVGDFADPARYPEGIPYVIVNGQLVIDDGKHTGALPGKVLRHPTP
jgi:N-acyl-D-aspartate/D-glutamate deacylase